MSKNIFLSIITVHLKDYSRLAETSASLQPTLAQGDVEWILVDGGSMPNDPDEQVLFENLSQTASIFISDPDDGIYDAMNKGLSLTSGEYLLFLNAGDTLHPEFELSSIRDSIRVSKPDMVWGLTQYEYPDGSTGVRKLRGPRWMMYGMPVCHQSVLFSRQKFFDLKYDTSYDIVADYELLARAIKSGARVELSKNIISRYSTGGVSQQDRKRSLQQEGMVRVKYYKLPVKLSNLLAGVKGILWKISDISPALNRFWRKII